MTDQNKNPHAVGATEGTVNELNQHNSTNLQTKSILAQINNDNADYEPIFKPIESETYPFDALPETILNAVGEVRNFTKAPIALIATSAISALSLAAQAQINVKRDNNLTGPVSLFSLTIADSGERKSTVDAYLTKEIRNYDVEQSQKYLLLEIEYKNNMKVWESKEKGLLTKIKKASEAGEDTSHIEASLLTLRNEIPKKPKTPRLMYVDATPEALGWNLANTWPTGGIISSEGGSFLGSHAMNHESAMRTFSLINTMWDGGSFQSDRRQENNSYTIHSARLTVGLQVQESTLIEFINRAGELARGTGFFARFLFAKPVSTQGTRLYSPPSLDWSKLNSFNLVIKRMLDRYLPMNFNNILSPELIEMTEDAKELWINFYNTIEQSLGANGELYNVRDLASKSADNAARLAALFQFFENIEHNSSNVLSPITEDNIFRASRIIAWHLNEAVNFFSERTVPEEVQNAIKLEKWLVSRTKKYGEKCFPTTLILQKGPTCVRKRESLDNAISVLVDKNRLQMIDGLREIFINESILKDACYAS